MKYSPLWVSSSCSVVQGVFNKR